METEGYSFTPWTGRSAGRHVFAAGTALLLSSGLHVALLRMLPPLPVGRPPEIEFQVPFSTVQMRDVRRNMTDTIHRPEVYRPESPEDFMDTTVPAAEITSALDSHAPPQTPEIGTGPLAGEGAALAEPAPVAERNGWEPRQEILAIEEKIYADEVSALPRRYDAADVRSPAAPELTLPAEVDPAALLDRAALELRRQLAMTDGALLPDALFPGGGGGPGGTGMVGSPPAIREESGLLDETLEEITELKPVEQLLTLDLFTYVAPEEPGHTYFKIQIQRRGDEALPVLPKDVLLLQDCSESMTQRKLNACKQGVEAWLEKLGPEDRFEILGFRDTVDHCFGGWSANKPSARARANWFVEEMVSRGRTDVYESLRQLLALERSPDRPVVAVLITDGRPTMGLVDSSEIIESFTRENAGRVSIFSFGGGQRVNRYLLDLLSYKNRGDSTVVRDRDEIPEGLALWANQLARPVLTDLTWRFSGVDESEVYPRSLTHLYLDRPLVIHGRVPGELAPMVVQIVGRSKNRRHDMVFELAGDRAGGGSEALRSEWAWQKAYHLIGEHIRSGDEAVMAEIRGLEQHYGFLVPYGGDYPLR